MLQSEGSELFEKRIKCSKESSCTIKCSKAPKADILGNSISINYELSGVEITIPKTPLLGKGTKVRGSASGEKVHLIAEA